MDSGGHNKTSAKEHMEFGGAMRGGEKLGQFDLNICIFEMVSFKRVFIFSYFRVSTWLGTHLKVR